MKHSGTKRFVQMVIAISALAVGAVVLGGCARATLNGWAQNSPVIQPQPAVVNLGVKAD